MGQKSSAIAAENGKKESSIPQSQDDQNLAIGLTLSQYHQQPDILVNDDDCNFQIAMNESLVGTNPTAPNEDDQDLERALIQSRIGYVENDSEIEELAKILSLSEIERPNNSEIDSRELSNTQPNTDDYRSMAQATMVSYMNMFDAVNFNASEITDAELDEFIVTFITGEDLLPSNQANTTVSVIPIRLPSAPSSPPVFQPDENECQICFDAPRNCVILNCRHQFCCYSCAQRIYTCSICTNPITKRVQIAPMPRRATTRIGTACFSCNAAPYNCVFLNCRHQCMCHSCGQRMSNCPVCEKRIVGVIEVYRC